MNRFRIALLITYIKTKLHPFLSRWVLSLILIVVHVPLAHSDELTPFKDLPQDPMYRPYIEMFQRHNVIVGDTLGGLPTNTLRPNDPIQRAEFAKITALIRLLEEKQSQSQSAGYHNLDLNQFTLKTNTDFTPFYSTQAGDVHFPDVPDKPVSCAKDPAGCEPWFGQFVNYAVHLGLLKGFPDGKFHPDQSILRIHALKLIMAQDGNLPVKNDPKFQALSSDPRIKNVTTPKCLKGAEPFILKNNGDYSQDSYNLLSYALLADKLDLFGNECQLFTLNQKNTPQQRADFLQAPLTRKEIARYFSLTTTYLPLQTDSQSDPTTSTEIENGVIYFDPKYDPSAHTPDLVPPVSEESVQSKQKGELEKSVAEKLALPGLKTAEEKALMPVSALAQLNQTGRCCPTMSVEAGCQVIHFSDFTISDSSSYNFQNYDGGLWQQASRPGQSCWIPFGDLLNGYNPATYESGICSMDENKEVLMNHYLNAYLKMEVTRIWTTDDSKQMKFYRQLSLDAGIKLANQLKKSLQTKKPNCLIIDDQLTELQNIHQVLYP